MFAVIPFRTLALIGLLSLTNWASCLGPRAFDGVIEWRNRSCDTLHISDVTGFGEPVGCGYLVADGVASLHLQPMRYPTKTTLRWEVGEGEPTRERETTLDLESQLQARRNAVLVFEYTKEGKWVVCFEDKKPSRLKSSSASSTSSRRR